MELSRESLIHEMEILQHKDKWTKEDMERIAAIKSELEQTCEGSVKQPVKRAAIPENQTLPYSLARIRERFGR